MGVNNKMQCRDEYKRMLAKLSRLRKKMGLSQHQLADKLGWDHLLLQKVEACEHRLDLVELHHLCQALDQDASTLLKRLTYALRNSGNN
jgi:transcriptional regulator with XRE-family HTH domain